MISGEKEKLFQKVIDKLDLGSNVSIMPLAGDASTREYYKITYPSGTKILMSEKAFNPENDPYILCQRAFSKMGTRVPLIDKTFPDYGIIVQEYLGDKHLQNIRDRNKLIKYYDQALDMLLNYQKQGSLPENKELYPLGVKFTKEKFVSELIMTTDYYLLGLKKFNIEKGKIEELNKFYKELVEQMMDQPFLLLHRDYHSRNLIINNEDVYVIDFQDAKLGPFTYDLASLLVDPYIDIDSQMKDKLIKTYYVGIQDVTKCLFDDFQRYYKLCYLQRGIKILGTFAYQNIKRGSSIYLQYIPITIERIKGVLPGFPQWNSIISEVILA